MLRQMRTFTRSWFAMALLFLLMGAFAIWGINDVFSGVSAQNVAKVGNRDITPAQLSREMELTLRAQRREGNNMSQAEAVEQGLHLRLLESLITRTALYHFAEKLGISASNAQVASRIRQIPAVSNPLSGAFDEAAYQQFLNDYRYGQAEFETEMRNDLTSEMLRHALTIGVRAPSSYGAMVLAFESERRTITIAEAPLSIAGAVAPPTDVQLQDFYEDNAARLQVPEYRALTLVYARPQDFAARVDVPEARLREEFAARSAALTEPERRTYVRLAAANEAQARDAVARLDRGEAPNAVAQALGMQMARSENQTREQVSDAAVAEAVFAIAPGAGARAVQATLSPWAVVRLESVTAARAPDYAAARDALRNEIAMEEAGELLNAAVSAFEDARAGGTSPADAARAAGLTVVSIPAVNAQGGGPDGQPVAALADHADIVGTAFDTAEGEASDFLPSGDADVVISVDRVTPASVRPLADVREDLIASWMANERLQRVQALADEVIAAVQGGGDFAAAARARRFNVVVNSQAIDRQSANQLPARTLGANLFSNPAGAVISDVRADGRSVLIAHIESITRTDPATSPQLVEAARVQMQSSLGASLDEAISAQIVALAHPRRNERVIERMFAGARTDEEGEAPAAP